MENDIYVRWEKIGDGPANIVGHAQRVFYSSKSDALFNEITNWKEKVKDHNGFPVKRYITLERLVQNGSDIMGLNQDG
jgi:hypothetical protein